MNRIQLNKEKFLRFKVVPDFLDLTPAKENKSLDKITEVSEPNTSFYRKDLTPTPAPSSEFKSLSQISPFYINFLQTLQKFDKLYFFFYNSATPTRSSKNEATCPFQQ